MTEIKISKSHARAFMVSHHHLNPARQLEGKKGILEYVRHVNCIQYDPINVVGQNPHLLLQSRVKNYQALMLDELLYTDRMLIDGFDKMMSIYPREDWPLFSHHRQHYKAHEYKADNILPAEQLRKIVLEKVRNKGPISSIEMDIVEFNVKVAWSWGSTKASRAGLEMLFYDGELLVAHRKGTRRYFDLAEKLLPKNFYTLEDPHPNKKSRMDWHVHRRVGGLGLAHWGAGEHWGAMLGMKSVERRQSIERLFEKDLLIKISIKGIDRDGFFIRQADLETLESSSKSNSSRKSASILGALDNFMWDRKLLRWLFDFNYVWEVYKPVKLRKYGYYVLPILYGNKFVARFEPGFNRKNGRFEIKNWWWEDSAATGNKNLQLALRKCFKDFLTYLDAKSFVLGEKAEKADQLKKIFAPLA